MNKQIYLLGLMSLVSFSAMASPIEGYTEKALSENSGTLASIIKLEQGSFFSKETCSSTLVAKNILLTANHCADQLVAGSKITLNDNPEYEVVSVISAPGKLEQRGLSIVSTDLSLVMFKSTHCENSALTDIKPISIANEKIANELSKNVLIAGYGITSPEGTVSGVLHAGYNQWAVSDFGQNASKEIHDPIVEVSKMASGIDNALMMIDGRPSVSAIQNLVGSRIGNNLPISVDLSSRYTSALPQHGDSGSSAIQFDAKGKPYIVGVDSMGAPQVNASEVKLAIVNDQNQILMDKNLGQMTSEEQLKNSLRAAMDEALKILTEQSYVSRSQIVLKQFVVILNTDRVGMGIYSSVVDQKNHEFIDHALKKMTKQRDSEKFCQ